MRPNEKTIRKLAHLWTSLVKPDNFVIPETAAEFKQLGGFFAQRIKVNSIDCYFNEKSKLKLNEFLDCIYQIKDIQDSVSFEFVYDTTLSSIEASVNRQVKDVKESKKALPEKDVKNLFKKLTRKRTRYQFNRILTGVELVGAESFSFGDVELFTFSKKNILDINKLRESNNSNKFYDQNIGPFIKKNFLNKTCLRAVANGDEKKAYDIAMRKIRAVINMLRFIVCILSYDRVSQNLVKINLLGESHDVSENTFTVDVDSKKVSLKYGTSRKPLQKFPFDLDMIARLKEYYFWDDWIHILSKQEKTELEEAILTSVYWIGEGQNDFSYESAFVKFWTALETLFSISDEVKKSVQCPYCKQQFEGSMPAIGITQSLAMGVAILLSFGGYRFIEIGNVKTIIKAMMKLYKKRSLIIHRGSFGHVSPNELSEICKYAVWSVLTCLGLRTQGFKSLKQVRRETLRLYELSQLGRKEK